MPLLLAALPALAAQGPAAYGDQFARAGKTWADGEPGVAAPLPEVGDAVIAPLSPSDQAGYRGQVEVLEVAVGPYANGLAEPLSSLARHYRNAGDLASAQQHYLRALHVVRINDGLNSDLQLPLVRELLDTYREAGELEKLDQRYEYFFRLYGQGLPPYTDLRLRADVEYLRWQREALRNDLGRSDKRRLLDLFELNEDLLAAIREHGPVAYHWYRELVLSQLRNLYLVQSRIAPKIEEVGLVHFNPLAAPNTGLLGDENLEDRRLEVIQRGAVNRGGLLLEELIGRAAAEGQVAVAAAQLELADWYQWNGQQSRANKGYSKVVITLREAAELQTLENWLAQPRELPDNGAFWQPRPLAEGERRVVLRASYDVSAAGRARNIVATAPGESDESVARKLRRELSRTRFRPRFLQGMPEGVSQQVVDYELID